MDRDQIERKAEREGWSLEKRGDGYRINGHIELRPAAPLWKGEWWVWQRGRHGANKVRYIQGLGYAVNDLPKRVATWEVTGPHKGDWVVPPLIPPPLRGRVMDWRQPGGLEGLPLGRV